MLGPGMAKPMRARRLACMLPGMPLAEAIDTTCLHRVAGLTGDHTACVTVQCIIAG
jgi:predicted ATPase with chaperone activity